MEKYEALETDSPIAPPGELKSCPIDNTFKIIGKKFTVLILRNMVYHKQKHFNEFLNSIEGINPNTLSIRLREMEKICWSIARSCQRNLSGWSTH